MNPGTVRYVDCVWGTAANNVYGGTEGGSLVHFDGDAWTELSVTIGPFFKARMWGTSATNMFVVGTSGEIWHFDGVNATSMPSAATEFLLGIWGSSASDIFAVGISGTLLHYDGAAWSRMSGGLTQTLQAVWAHSDEDVFAVGGSVYHYDGLTWSDIGSGVSNSANDVWGSAPDDVFIAASDGLYHYDGVGWSLMPTGLTPEPNMRSIWGLSASDVFAVGDGFILRYDGVAWNQMPWGPPLEVLLGVHGRSATDVFAVGFLGVIQHFDGATWAPMVSGTTENLYDVWVDASGSAVAIGGTALHYDGNAWNELTVPGLLGSVWGRSPTDVFASSGGVVMHYDGVVWTQNSPWFGQTLHGVFGTGCDVFAVGSGGVVVKSEPDSIVSTVIPRSPSYVTLLQNHPNPFNPATVIRYALPVAGDVKLEIFDVLGRRVAVLVDEYESEGYKSVEWSGKNEAGEAVASGVYVYRLKVGDFAQSRKMLLLK
jgi:hypothetical protein